MSLTGVLSCAAPVIVSSIVMIKKQKPARRLVVLHLTCLLTTLANSNIEIWSLLPNIGFSFASALIILLFFLSCRLFFLIYSQIFFTISVLGMGLLPTTSAREGLGV